jgi:hypothetical protein
MNGRLQLLRTGPFVPPMAVSGLEDLVVTKAFRPELEGLAGVKDFLPVIKEKIVRMDWSSWRLAADEPKLTQFREPADSILSGMHDPTLAEENGELYEVILEPDGEIDEDFAADGAPIATFSEVPKRGYALFKAMTVGGFGTVIGSDQFVSSLSSDVTRWLEFTKVSVLQSDMD